MTQVWQSYFVFFFFVDSFKSICLLSGYFVIKNVLQCGWHWSCCRPGHGCVMSMVLMLFKREIVIHCDVWDCIKVKLVFVSFAHCWNAQYIYIKYCYENGQIFKAILCWDWWSGDWSDGINTCKVGRDRYLIGLVWINSLMVGKSLSPPGIQSFVDIVFIS